VVERREGIYICLTTTRLRYAAADNSAATADTLERDAAGMKERKEGEKEMKRGRKEDGRKERRDIIYLTTTRPVRPKIVLLPLILWREMQWV
jgi:hypothetical protein